MQRILSLLEAATTGRPWAVIVVLLVLTVASAGLARNLKIEVDLTEFGREGSVAVETNERVRDKFGDPARMVQVILDAGEGGNVLTPENLQTLGTAEDLVIDTLGDDIRVDEFGEPLVRSARMPIQAALDEQGVSIDETDPRQISAMAGAVLGSRPEHAALLSDDYDPGTGDARGALIVAFMDTNLNEDERTQAAERVARAFGIASGEPIVKYGSLDVTVFSDGIFVSSLTDSIRAEIPQLFGLALLVVVAILALAYRSIFDVIVGLVGLIVTVIWTFGLIALLGPGLLGWTGPFSQLGVIVPVLLVGLGIDYSMHLTARYREQRLRGEEPRAAAGGAIRTVGTALILATVGTAIGFGGNAIAPVAIIADFGIFVAAGVICAFIVMGLLVPSARVLRDRRRSDAGESAVRAIELERVMRTPAQLAVRLPLAGLIASVLLVAISLVAAAGLVVEFDRDDFIPQGSDVETILSMQRALFGANVNELTFVVVDADFTDPATIVGIQQAQSNLSEVSHVRKINDEPQALSIVTLAGSAAQMSGDGFNGSFGESGPPSPDELTGVYETLRDTVGEERFTQFVSADYQSGLVQIQTTGGDGGADALRDDIERAFMPVVNAGGTVAISSEPIIMSEMSDDLASFQAQSIGITLSIVLVLLAAYYRLTHRSALLGVIAMTPAIVAASLVLGVMWLLGISFNVLTATLTAVAIGIGVPYGVHVVNRFVQDRGRTGSIDEAVGRTLDNTGAALIGSALTTLGAFAVLSFSGLPPIQSLGLLGAFSIVFALLAAVLVEPGALVLWDRWSRRYGKRDEQPASSD